MFASYPKKKYLRDLDLMLEEFDENKDSQTVKLDFIIELLEKLESEKKEDWNNMVYINCVKAIKSSQDNVDGILIVRRNRDIRKAPRTMLSPDDRALGKKFDNKVVLTVYRINGVGKEKGWGNDVDSGSRWMPNIRLPDQMNFYKTEN